VQLGKQLGQVVGRDLSSDSAQRVGVALHRTFGMSYGMAASLLVCAPDVGGAGDGRRGVRGGR